MPGNLKNLHSYTQESVLLLLQCVAEDNWECYKFTVKNRGWEPGGAWPVDIPSPYTCVRGVTAIHMWRPVIVTVSSGSSCLPQVSAWQRYGTPTRESWSVGVWSVGVWSVGVWR